MKRQTMAALALFAMACGGGDKGGQPQASAPAPGAAAPQAAAPAATGTVHEVKMELVSGQYRFDPKALTIKVGDTVKWINVSGGPHNVSFYKDKIPAGASDVLAKVMPNLQQNLDGPFLTDSMAVYQVSFAGAPAGQYAYTCQPHEALGMNAALTITK